MTGVIYSDRDSAERMFLMQHSVFLLDILTKCGKQGTITVVITHCYITGFMK